MNDQNVSAANLPTLSIVVPVLNEQESLIQLLDELKAGVGNAVTKFEVIFVDDGSTDESWRVIKQLSEAAAATPRPVFGIRLRRNFGKAAALTAGMKIATGELILMLDADLQDDPAEFSAQLRQINAGYDVVNGWKERRLDPWHKVYPSKVFNWLVGAMSGLKLHDHNCGLKLFRTEVAREVQIYGELHRFIPVLAHARGFKVAEVAVNHRSRQYGHSKYGVRRFIRGLLDLLTVSFLTGFALSASLRDERIASFPVCRSSSWVRVKLIQRTKGCDGAVLDVDGFREELPETLSERGW
ncbi:MAG: glycosyltransferase family 2 protein, partial [Planctomycetota bacterium]